MTELLKVVLVVSGQTIRAAQVVGEELRDPIEMEWNENLLRKAFAVIKDRYHANRIRLVLDEDLSHTLDLEIPVTTAAADERQVVADLLRSKIPDILNASTWDYKIKDAKADAKVVTVFVPVQEKLMSLTDAATKEGLEIEAVEPIGLSLARHPNPLVGMALKTDLRGDDRQVLNVQPELPSEPVGSLEAPPARSGSRVSRPTMMIIGAVILLGLLAFGVLAAVRRQASSPAPSPSATPIASPSPLPSPSPEPAELSDLKLQVLNGAGVPGQASAVASLLAKAGFGEAAVGNAANYNFTDTLISVKPDTPETAYLTAAKALQSNYTVKKGAALDTDSEYDVVVTVGVSKTAAKASPKPSASASPRPSSNASPSPSASGSPRPSTSASPSPSASAN